MAFNEEAKRRRKCTGTKADGTPCKAWALWDDPRQLCVCHAGRHFTGEQPFELAKCKSANYTPCRCAAYKWPHRPGGGFCRWPLPPLLQLTTPAGTHREPRIRLSKAMRAAFYWWKELG